MKTVILLLCALSIPSSSVAQVRLPDTAAGRQFAAWLQPFNAGDRPGLERFLNDVLLSKGDRTVEGDLGFREQTGGFDLLRVDQSTESHIAGVVKERDSDLFAQFRIDVQAEAPFRITRFELFVIPRPAEFVRPRMTESQLLDAVSKEVATRAARDQFSGAFLIAKDGKVLLTGAYGLADRTHAAANVRHTKFRNGSINKMFTAVAALQLVQAGRLRLQDYIGQHFPQYPNREVAARVTIHQLLTHTGGTGDIFGPEFSAHRLDLRTHGDYVRMFGSRGLMFEPGDRWQYSNYGFVLLGAIIERITGQSYYDYVRDHVFTPAGMTATGSDPEDQPVPDRSVGYTRAPGVTAWRDNSDTLPYRGTAAGGGYTTVDDLLRFAMALQKHILLNAEFTTLLTTGKVEGGPGKYAYGFGDVTTGDVRWFGHNGGAPGMNGDLRIFPANGYVVAALANQDPPAAGRITEFITDRLPSR